jgi:hypothetical protein
MVREHRRIIRKFAAVQLHPVMSSAGRTYYLEAMMFCHWMLLQLP